MSLFLEELKNKNPTDSQRDNYLPPSNEELTTNLYIGNINPNVTEERLYDLFRRYGEINSIKIMWPRTEEERVRRRNCGFISFMKRKVHHYSLYSYLY
jgi:U2-associated protein SR140